MHWRGNVARHYARELALKVLYEQDLVHDQVVEILDRTLQGASQTDGDYARSLVEGTLADLGQIDQRIASAAHDWRVARMPPIDRNILRLGCYEMVHESNVPISVIIDEALELAQSYSTEDAKRFVNGVLGTIAQQVRPQGDTDRP